MQQFINLIGKEFQMKEIGINYGGHKWEKINHVTQKDRNGLYDLMRCSKCGIMGKRYSLDSICIYERYINKMRCSVNAQYMKILHCRAFGHQFENLTDGSIHEIIAPPDGQNNDRGVWVMGVGEPVLVLFGEFDYCDVEGGTL